VPTTEAGVVRLFRDIGPALEPSGIVFEFLDIMERAPVLPAGLRPFQRLLVRAAVDITPAPIRATLRLGREKGLRPWESPPVRLAGAVADRLILRTSPPVQACLRLGLPAEYLYRPRDGHRATLRPWPSA
jgi:uncharacterized protein (DUF2236 family)